MYSNVLLLGKNIYIYHTVVQHMSFNYMELLTKKEVNINNCYSNTIVLSRETEGDISIILNPLPVLLVLLYIRKQIVKRNPIVKW